MSFISFLTMTPVFIYMLLSNEHIISKCLMKLYMKVFKKAKLNNQTITCSHIGHVDIKNVYLIDTQSVKICWNYNNLNINARQLCMKILWKRNKIKSHSITSFIIPYILQVSIVHQIVCVLIRHTFFISLVKICVTKHKCR